MPSALNFKSDYGKVRFYKNGKLKFYYRENTSDIKSIREVIERGDYERRDFKIEPGENWLDLGAYIGTFSVLAASRGANVTAFEPFPESYALLCRNIKLNSLNGLIKPISAAVVANGSGEAFLGINKNGNLWRNSIIRTPAKGGEVSVKTIALDRALLDGVDGIKMDIEGSEFQLLENLEKFKSIKKLVYEHSFDVNNSIPVYLDIIKRLQEVFPHVIYKKVPLDALEYKWFPPCCKVWCWK